MDSELERIQAEPCRLREISGLPGKPDTSDLAKQNLFQYFRPFMEADITDAGHAGEYAVNLVRDNATGDISIIYNALDGHTSPGQVQLNLDGTNQVRSIFVETFHHHLFSSVSEKLFYESGKRILSIRTRKWLFFKASVSENMILIQPVEPVVL